jgi:TfoX/Sxy family transcriptional regulator of competence genes
LRSGRLAVVTADATPARKLYDDLTDDLLYDPAVGRSTMMGHPCVRRAGRFFASFDPRDDCLVVKLPAERVEALIDKGTGQPFAPNGKVFREWVSIPTPNPSGWARLLAEALDFAGPAQQQARRGYDEDLAERIREVLGDLGVGVREQKMFGGLAFLVNGHMAVAASGEGGLLLGVDPSEAATLLGKAHTRPMVMRGRQMAGWIRVAEEGLRTKRQLTPWVRRGVEHARSKPTKRRRAPRR